MHREFNDTGLCHRRQHYMVDISPKLNTIIKLIQRGKYFTINRPRQFGKTTTLYLLAEQLNQHDDYIVLQLSFEGIDATLHQQRDKFIRYFLKMLIDELTYLNQPGLSAWLAERRETITTLTALNGLIGELVGQTPDKAWVLLIDEVDQSGNYQLFFDFLAMLRLKYLDRGRRPTFHAVVLAGVHDVKTLRSKIRGDQTSSYNSPWNIAIDFKVDLSFSGPEIETMLADYAADRQVDLDIPAIAERLYYYTSGYPYLVSKLCKFIDEEIVAERGDENWLLADVETGFRMIVADQYSTTLFDSLAKNLDNNPELYEFVSQIVLNGARFPFVVTNQLVNLGQLYGILASTEGGYCRIHNRIFEQRIYAHLLLRLLQTTHQQVNSFGGPAFYSDDQIDVPLILRRFQAFMRENYTQRDAKFLEREGRLLFLAFLKPILNGRGFEFKEPVVADERRMDIVITYRTQRYVIELKRWYGPSYHQKGLQQLSDYLDMYDLREGYLLIYDFSKGKAYEEELIQFRGKQIFAVWV